MNYVCKDKSHLDINECKKVMQKWLNTTYGTYSLEPHYTKIPHRIYCESFLGEKLIDYKIHCLNGKPEFFLVVSERNSKENKMQTTLDVYDTKWNYIDDAIQNFGGDSKGHGSIPKPALLNEMLKVARILSIDFDFVRVDLYEMHGQVYFGELTFSPANGVFPYYTDNFIKNMGMKLTINKSLTS